MDEDGDWCDGYDYCAIGYTRDYDGDECEHDRDDSYGDYGYDLQIVLVGTDYVAIDFCEVAIDLLPYADCGRTGDSTATAISCIQDPSSTPGENQASSLFDEVEATGTAFQPTFDEDDRYVIKLTDEPSIYGKWQITLERCSDSACGEESDSVSYILEVAYPCREASVSSSSGDEENGGQTYVADFYTLYTGSCLDDYGEARECSVNLEDIIPEVTSLGQHQTAFERQGGSCPSYEFSVTVDGFTDQEGNSETPEGSISSQIYVSETYLYFQPDFVT